MHLAPPTPELPVPDVEAAHADMTRRGAEITDQMSDKAWGLRQFTVQDAYGNLFHIFHDL